MNKEQIIEKVNQCTEKLKHISMNKDLNITIIYDKLGDNYKKSILYKLNFFSDYKYQMVIYYNEDPHQASAIYGIMFNNENLFSNEIYSYSDVYKEINNIFKYELNIYDCFLYNKNDKDVFLRDFISNQVVLDVQRLRNNNIINVIDIRNALKIGEGYSGTININPSKFKNDWDKFRENNKLQQKLESINQSKSNDLDKYVQLATLQLAKEKNDMLFKLWYKYSSRAEVIKNKIK